MNQQVELSMVAVAQALLVFVLFQQRSTLFSNVDRDWALILMPLFLWILFFGTVIVDLLGSRNQRFGWSR
jgi:tryptophan-rich sensory protein